MTANNCIFIKSRSEQIMQPTHSLKHREIRRADLGSLVPIANTMTKQLPMKIDIYAIQRYWSFKNVMRIQPKEIIRINRVTSEKLHTWFSTASGVPAPTTLNTTKATAYKLRFATFKFIMFKQMENKPKVNDCSHVLLKFALRHSGNYQPL